MQLRGTRFSGRIIRQAERLISGRSEARVSARKPVPQAVQVSGLSGPHQIAAAVAGWKQDPAVQRRRMSRLVQVSDVVKEPRKQQRLLLWRRGALVQRPAGVPAGSSVRLSCSRPLKARSSVSLRK